MTSSKDKTNPKKDDARNGLPDELKGLFDRFVAEYQYHCMVKYERPFVSYAVLADLVKDGWRPTHEPFLNPETFMSEFNYQKE